MNTENNLYEMNYTWLSLAQKMLLKDKSIAMFRLELNARVAGIIGGMTEKELQKLSTHPHFIFTLRIQNPVALECLLADSRVDHLTPMQQCCASQELEDTQLAIELISPGARMQLLENSARLSRGKMTRLYRELRGLHRLKVCFPFQLTGL